MKTIDELSVKIFADGADLPGMLELYGRPYIKGFTTNPTLMRKAGISDYSAFARAVLAAIPDRPISFEVIANDLSEMRRQAHVLAGLGSNVYVKIPVTNTQRESTLDVIHGLARDGVKVNVTAIMTLAQVCTVSEVLTDTPSYVSVFAGRVADTGVDPTRLMRASVSQLAMVAPHAELIWASPRELLNIFQADAAGCHVITVTRDILRKLEGVGRDLADLSLDTVKMFYNDAVAAGYTL